jgi:3-phosphoinositide dependent protein kinase-1
MEYLSKGDFSDFIRLNFPLKIDTIQFYAAEIVSFLEYIQSKKIVHRDLKPENIMMNENWHLQVIDFATARILGKYFDKKKMVFKDDAISNDNNKKNEIKENQKI